MKRKYFKSNVSINEALEYYWARDLKYKQVKKEISHDFNINLFKEEWINFCIKMDKEMDKDLRSN